MVVTPEELAATLIARKRRALEAERERAVAIRKKLDAVMQEQGRAGRFTRAFLIGSLESGKFGAGSDVDVVVEGLDPKDVGVLYGLLIDALGVEVDLLRLEELSTTFKDRVLQEGMKLYGS